MRSGSIQVAVSESFGAAWIWTRVGSCAARWAKRTAIERIWKRRTRVRAPHGARLRRECEEALEKVEEENHLNVQRFLATELGRKALQVALQRCKSAERRKAQHKNTRALPERS